MSISTYARDIRQLRTPDIVKFLFARFISILQHPRCIKFNLLMIAAYYRWSFLYATNDKELKLLTPCGKAIYGAWKDLGVIRSYFLYKYDYIKYLERIFPDKKRICLIVDLGARIGAFTLAVASPLSRIIAYEPEPVRCKHLSLNLPRGRNSIAIDKAISQHDKLPMYSSSAGRHHTAFPEYRNDKPRWQVLNAPSFVAETETIEDVHRRVGEETVDILKINTNGAEREILRNISEKFLQQVRCIVLEVHYLADPLRWTLKQWGDWLCQGEFHIFYSIDQPVLVGWNKALKGKE